MPTFVVCGCWHPGLGSSSNNKVFGRGSLDPRQLNIEQKGDVRLDLKLMAVGDEAIDVCEGFRNQLGLVDVVVVQKNSLKNWVGGT